MSPTVVLQFMLCPVVFLSLMKITAPYGRHFVSGWGPSLPNRTAWFLMELPALLIFSIYLWFSEALKSPVALIPWLLWSTHYAYRSFVFPALMRPSGKNFPALLVVFAVLFNWLNSYNNSQALFHNSANEHDMISIHFISGLIIFCLGFYLHTRSDQIIRHLRSDDFAGYRIPQGGLFKWVSNPHYLGEMVQWSGWAILTWSWAGTAFALFTFCNLAPRALANHRWYKQKFSEYPTERKVLIPFFY
jgi:3-oxo-5-alpha-steroid 4-dehydrogenase 1